MIKKHWTILQWDSNLSNTHLLQCQEVINYIKNYINNYIKNFHVLYLNIGTSNTRIHDLKAHFDEYLFSINLKIERQNYIF